MTNRGQGDVAAGERFKRDSSKRGVFLGLKRVGRTKKKEKTANYLQHQLAWWKESGEPPYSDLEFRGKGGCRRKEDMEG